MTDEHTHPETGPPPGAEPAQSPSGFINLQIVRILAVVALLCALFSTLCVFGDWHVVKGSRLLGAPGGDCAGRPCMEVIRETKTCKGTSHVPGLSIALGVLAMIAQALVLASPKRGLALGMTIALIPLSLVGLALPGLTGIDHLFSDSTLAASGSMFSVLFLIIGGLAVTQLVLVTMRWRPPSAPRPHYPPVA